MDKKENQNNKSTNNNEPNNNNECGELFEELFQELDEQQTDSYLWNY